MNTREQVQADIMREHGVWNHQTWFYAHENTYAALGGAFIVVGSLKLIGMKGLAFEHIYEHPIDASGMSVDIFAADNSDYIEAVPGKVIYDMPLRTKKVHTSLITTKICGLQFGTLSVRQQKDLKNFFTYHTTVLHSEAPTAVRPRYVIA